MRRRRRRRRRRGPPARRLRCGSTRWSGSSAGRWRTWQVRCDALRSFPARPSHKGSAVSTHAPGTRPGNLQTRRTGCIAAEERRLAGGALSLSDPSPRSAPLLWGGAGRAARQPSDAAGARRIRTDLRETGRYVHETRWSRFDGVPPAAECDEADNRPVERRATRARRASTGVGGVTKESVLKLIQNKVFSNILIQNKVFSNSYKTKCSQTHTKQSVLKLHTKQSVLKLIQNKVFSNSYKKKCPQTPYTRSHSGRAGSRRRSAAGLLGRGLCGAEVPMHCAGRAATDPTRQPASPALDNHQRHGRPGRGHRRVGRSSAPRARTTHQDRQTGQIRCGGR